MVLFPNEPVNISFNESSTYQFDTQYFYDEQGMTF